MTFFKSARLGAACRFRAFVCGALVLITLSGCTSHHDCTSPAVEGLMVEILESEAADERVLDAVGDASLRNVVTEIAQEDLGRFQCVGDLVYTPSDGDEVVFRVNYGVQQLQNSDEEFELTYPKNEFRNFEMKVALALGMNLDQALVERNTAPR